MRDRTRSFFCIFILGLAIVLLLWPSCDSTASNNIEPEDNSSYDFPEQEEPAEEESEEEDMEGKIVIAVRKPTDFRVYSKKEGVFIVTAKNKGEISGYDIQVKKVDTDTVTNYRAITTHNLFRRFVGGKPNSKYKVKVRTFRTINGKDYPSRWTKELQVIVWERVDEGTPSGTTLHELGRDKTQAPAAEENKKNKKKDKKNKNNRN